MSHYTICLATIFFVQMLCAQHYDGHFSVAPQNRSLDNNLGRYSPSHNPFTDPFVKKLCHERAQSWALHEQVQLLLRQQASWEVLPPDFVENFSNMTFWESYLWSHGQDDYTARWNNFIAKKSEIQTLSLLQRQANVYWLGLPLKIENRTAQLLKFPKQLKKLAEHADVMGKKPLLLTKYPFPTELSDIQELIDLLKIEVKVGY